MRKKISKVVFSGLLASFIGLIGQQTFAAEAPISAEIAAFNKCILKLHVKLGEQVKKGQLLFEEDDTLLKIEKEYDDEALKFDKDCLEKGKELHEKNSISHDVYAKLERNYNISQDDFASVQARLRTSKYYAPFDGTVTKIISYDGSAFNDNDPEMVITEGKVSVDTKKQAGMVCSRWRGSVDLKVSLGEKVKQGQLLFKIDTDDLEAQNKINESKLKYAQSVYEMNKKLNTKSVSPYKYYQSRLDYINALENEKTGEVQLKWASQYAPFDGTITNIVRYSGVGVGECKPVLYITASE